MPKSSGRLSEARLGRMHDVMTSYVQRGDVPGIVTLVSRRGDVHIDVIGMKALDGSDPMRRDTIFRISSLTKPITAAAAMILVEECKLRLDEPVDRLLPELADRKVLKHLNAPIEDTVPANRPITVRDLLTMRMGFGFIMEAGDYPILTAASKQQIVMGPPKPATTLAPDDWLNRFATLPLMHQPGEQWMYEIAFSVLGVLIARAAGQPLETFLRERIFAPLGMKDTGFSVPTSNLNRLATCYWTNFESGAFEVYDDVHDSQWNCPPAFPDAAGGLVSTIDDYLSFGQMMLDKGKHGSERILSRLSVEVMTTDQLLPRQRTVAGPFLEDNRGWGFGVSVISQRDDISAVPRRFGWDGGLGTSWYADPTEEMVAIVMTQRLPPPSNLFGDFWTSAYQSIDD